MNTDQVFLFVLFPLSIFIGVTYAILTEVKEESIFTISPIFAWYDIWVGVFYDKKKNWIYILPLPCLGIIIKIKP